MEGFVAKPEMPVYLSLLFRARRPLDPLPALHKAKYDTRPLEPLIDQHHAIGSQQGLLGCVSKENGEGWLKAIFEDRTGKEGEDEEGLKNSECKEQRLKRVQKQKIKKNLADLKVLTK